MKKRCGEKKKIAKGRPEGVLTPPPASFFLSPAFLWVKGNL
jgi:hypothetical protein